MQGELELVAHARRTDPHTSHEAAASITSESIRKSQLAVLRVLCGALGGASTDEELADEYETCRTTLEWCGLPRQSVSGIRTRRKELCLQGYVVNSGKTEPSMETGRRMIVWEATDKGVALWETIR